MSSSPEPAATGKLQTKQNIYLKWIIENFSAHIKSGEDILSPTFDNSWTLGIDPNGCFDKEYLSITIYNERNLVVKASCSIYILDKFGAKTSICKSKQYLKFQRSESGNNGLGLSRGIKKSELLHPSSNWIVNDTLTIFCEISIGDDGVSLHNRVEEFDAFEKLLNNEHFSDIAILVENKKILAHRTIIASQSPVFEAMFTNGMKETQENVVEIQDISYDVFIELLRFIYCGKVNNIDIANELLVAADRFAIDELKKWCCQALISNVNLDNVLESLTLASSLTDATRLKNNMIIFIKQHAKEIVTKPEFAEFIAKNPLVAQQIVCEIVKSS